ncbi:head-tail joining protein [Billgrantia bachuensis]|uniref:Uncharacterized protein n=1 Tax=Billgrantia bachuensis TaxID=2717286 RepID=A0ABX0PQ67_9GAMM|nr:hypothetical protein [Halomonas bachuensis]NIC05261.1 hypothetical protein [Halomonas bachuensis]
MSFADLANRLDEAVRDHLADDHAAVYHPKTGDPVPDVWVIIDRDVIPVQQGQPTTTVERRTELTGASDVLGDARSGDTVVSNGETWRLQRRDRDDGHMVTWIVVEVL